MKKFIAWLCATLAAGIIAIVGSVAVISCENGPRVLHPAVAVEQVENCLDSIVNPRLYTCRDVFELQQKLLVNAYIDSVFMSMDQEILNNVSTVVLKKLHVVTKDDIVSEYVKGGDIYNNLPSKSDPPAATTDTIKQLSSPVANIQVVKEGTTTVTEAPPTRVDDKPGNYKDTVIDGKHAIIKQ